MGLTTEQIIALLQAGGLVILAAGLLTGQIWARPAYEKVVGLLGETVKTGIDRESKLERQRDEAIAGWKSQTAATLELAAGMRTLTIQVERLVSERKAR